MLLICGLAGGTGVTGTLYGPDEDAPTYRGAPDVVAPYVWVCDEFYRVASGGQPLALSDDTVQVAFERPTPRGFDDRERAITAAKTHIDEQLTRIGVTDEPTFHTESVDQDAV